MYKAEGYYPPSGFFFTVDLGGPSIDASFQEVSGLDVERELEEIAEGGLNDYKHRVPKQISYSNLVLKRGLVVENSDLGNWVRETLRSGLSSPIEPKDILIHLLDTGAGKDTPLMSWSVVKAYPVKWSISGFNSTESGIMTETLEFAFRYFEIK